MLLSRFTKEWLLSSDSPYIQYNAEQFFNINTDHNKLLNDPFIEENIDLLSGWNKEILKNHNSPKLLMHRLALLADLGVKADDKPIKPIIMQILENFDEKNIPQVLIELPKVFGGTGIPGMAWMLCDFPVILASLLKMGIKNNKIKSTVLKLKEFARSNGYGCISSIPKVRGPGKKDDFCPYANLVAAKALSGDSESINSKAAELACESLLYHWETKGQKKHYLFGIGTDFQKIKYPFVWYNILHMAEVLSRFKHIHKDKRFLEMTEVITGKADENLRFKPESIYMIHKTQDFGNKKEYSRIITLAVLKILKRMGKIKI
jgi:hypothetical protein